MAANKQPMQNENQWHKFLRDECENLKRLGIHFEGQGTTMSYIAEKWQIEKADAAKVKAETARLVKIIGYCNVKAAKAKAEATEAKAVAKAKAETEAYYNARAAEAKEEAAKAEAKAKAETEAYWNAKIIGLM